MNIFWKWLKNVGYNCWNNDLREMKKVVVEWLDKVFDNEIMLFKEVLNLVILDDGLWMLYFNFMEVIGWVLFEKCI